jgi:UDP-N-acetylmuramoyl-tripeptide--D-alanyl-D-alanine ligase
VFRQADVFEALTGARPANASAVISEAFVDSRQVLPAGMFVALPGERSDGHDHVGQAFSLGAGVALIEREIGGQYPLIDLTKPALNGGYNLPDGPYCLKVHNTLSALQKIAGFWRSKLNVRVIGVTGSIGKSTTKELTGDVLSQHYRTLKSRGNLNNEIGLPLSILRLSSGHQHAVLEMGFYLPGEIKQLSDMAKPVIGVVTNVGPVHAARAGSLESIARGKAELVEALPQNGTAVLNFDDPLVLGMAEYTDARLFYYGTDPKADLWASHVESLGLEGIRFQLHYEKEVIHLRAPIPGTHSIYTILRAVSVGLLEGLSWQEIINGLRQSRSQMRMVAINTKSGATLIDDSYNSSPESAIAALNLLADMQGRKIAVLGDMLELGAFEEQGHIKVGQRAAEVCDILVAVGERTKTLVKAALAAGMPRKNIYWFSQVPKVTTFLASYLAAGDIALIKGSLGMAMSQIVTALEVTND